MISWDARRVAAAAGAELVVDRPGDGPARAVIDTRAVEPGDLFVGLPGERVDGGRCAADALAAGAWGVLVGRRHDLDLAGGAVLVADDPLAALQRLATAWRRALGAAVIGVTGSVGKTSTKQLLAALIAPARAVAANPANWNTEIGLPLAVLAAPEGTEVLVLEMGMRGFGQIDELARIAAPDVGVITTIGPVHLELVGDLDGVARAKGELLAHVRTSVVPAGERRLDPFLNGDVVRFGEGGDVTLESFAPPRVEIRARGARVSLEVPFTARHQLANLLAAVAAARAVGVEPAGRVDVSFGALRGEHVVLPSGAVVINDCYNANPLSMRAALDDLATHSPEGRRIAVLGDMLELGPGEREAHRELGEYAARSGLDALVAVGPLSAELAGAFAAATPAAAPDSPAAATPAAASGSPAAATPAILRAADAAEAAAIARELVGPGDVVLVKGSRGIALEAVAEALVQTEAPARG
jgi:UDP-N-acetylmuramoyl-tripeptide--D-alanyl-D-alanine ligase